MTATFEAIQAQAATIDGVPAFWVPGEGEFTAGLTFRVGMADETLAISGITHLIEHLTLYPIGRDGAPVRFNGQVDDLTTTFVATGAPADVAVFLEQVCRHLHALDPARLPAEREILKLEAGGHHGDDGAALRYWRFGPRTYGLTGDRELGVLHLAPQALADWAALHFTRDNAALWMTGPPPPSFRLPLPSGARTPVPVASSILPVTPAWYAAADDGGVVTASAVLTHSRDALALRHVVEHRLRARLRYELGGSYSPAAGYRNRDGRVGDFYLHATSTPTSLPAVREEILTVLDRIAAGGWDPAWLEEWRRDAVPPTHDPRVRTAWADGAARAALFGTTLPSFEALLADVATMTPQRVQRVAVEAARSALYQLPAGSPPPAGIAAAPTDSDAPIAGGYRFESRRDRPDAWPQVLRIDDTHLSLTAPSDNRHVTVELGRLAAMLAWPAGRRTLYSNDGFELGIDPDLWIGGHDLPRLLDERVPRAAVVPLAVDPLAVEPLAVEPGRVRPASRPQEPWKLWWLLLGMVVFVVAAGTVSARLGAHPLPGVILWGVVTARIGLHLHRTRRALGLRGLPRQS